MIQIVCDRCEQKIDVDDEQLEKVECPHCGDMNRVAKPAADARDQAATPAERPQRSASEPEREICVVRTAMFRAHPIWYVFIVLMFIAGIGLSILAPTSAQIDNWWTWVGLGAAAFAALWWVFWWAAPHRWVKLIITNKRTIRQEGIVMRKTSEVLHNHIRNIKIEQTVLDRLLGVGRISIDSAGGSDDELIEIVMENIPKPYEVKGIIDQYRKM